MDKLHVLLRYYDNMPLEEMNETHLRTFLLYLLEQKKLAAASINTYNSAFRFIFGAVMERNLNYQMIPRRRIHRELPQIMSKNDLLEFFNQIDIFSFIVKCLTNQ